MSTICLECPFAPPPPPVCFYETSCWLLNVYLVCITNWPDDGELVLGAFLRILLPTPANPGRMEDLIGLGGIRTEDVDMGHRRQLLTPSPAPV